MQGKGFKHIGKIISIEMSSANDSRGVVYVSIDPIAACQGCKAKSQCISMSQHSANGTEAKDSQSRVIKVESESASNFEVNDAVNVSVTYRIGVIAVVVAYIIPLFVFIAILVALISGFGVEQGVAALVTFSVLGLYYGVVYRLREYFERVVMFEIEKTQL